MSEDDIKMIADELRAVSKKISQYETQETNTNNLVELTNANSNIAWALSFISRIKPEVQP